MPRTDRIEVCWYEQREGYNQVCYGVPVSYILVDGSVHAVLVRTVGGVTRTFGTQQSMAGGEGKMLTLSLDRLTGTLG